MFAASKTAAPAAAANYIEDVFSTYLYTGNSSTQTITNGIDLSTKGGLVWLKSRASSSYDHQFVDTARGSTKYINSNNTNAETTNTNRLTAFNADGFTLGASAQVNEAPATGYAGTYASWTFRKQPKFFDVVTYTGNGSSNRNISHSLGSTPGCIIVKRTNAGGTDWWVWHRSISTGSLSGNNLIRLNLTSAGTGATTDVLGTASSTTFQVGFDGDVNGSGDTYVAYLFAHDAGGFGLTGTDNVVTCGSFTTDSGGAASVTLGYEPQWVMTKNSSGASAWRMFDTMRGMTVAGQNDALLQAQSSAAEITNSDYCSPTATGFEIEGHNGLATHIYIAIRRGPMKTPTSGTSVFYPQAVPQAATPDSTGVPFPPDLVNTFSRNGNGLRNSNWWWFNFVDRLRGLGVPNNTFTSGGPTLSSSSTNAEDTGTGGYVQLKADGQNITRGSGWNQPTYGDWIYYFMRRAPGFFDVVCYTGTGVNRTVTHNLGVAPELMIIKARSSGGYGWPVYAAAPGPTQFAYLDDTSSFSANSTAWNDTAPTASVFTVGTGSLMNTSSVTYVAYLFATVSGVSKVGSYTGTGTTKQIDCGFTGGARFVLIKRTDSTGDWYVWDSARGIVAGNDPYLLLNSTAAEVTNTDYVDTYSAGFEISSTAPAAINANGGSFIFLAIA